MWRIHTGPRAQGLGLRTPLTTHAGQVAGDGMKVRHVGGTELGAIAVRETLRRAGLSLRTATPNHDTRGQNDAERTARRISVSDPPLRMDPGRGWPTIRSAISDAAINASSSMLVEIPASSHMNTKSSVHKLPAAPLWAANGQPPRPPTDVSKSVAHQALPA